MAYSAILKEKITILRKKGHSLNEIHKEFGVSKSVISGWVRDIVLTGKAKSRLLSKIKLGQFISAENKRRKTSQVIESYFNNAVKDINQFKLDRNLLKTICSLIYCCEGTKNLRSGVNFTNSDYQLIRTFLTLFRKSFDVDENKFRVCVHLHQYHNTKYQLRFWSDITNIPLNQFIKPFHKKNGGKRIRKEYNGCASIRYHDTAMARQLLMIAKAFLLKYD